MITISLCMIVKDEEKLIERCLNSAQGIVDEIIIVDTGSTDRTKELVAQFTDKIFDFEWINDFSAARNFSFEQASMDYILWLDADDIILPVDVEKFIGLKKSMSEVFSENPIDIVMMRYNTGFDQQGNVTFSYFRERLIRRSRALKWKEPVHEYLEIGGKIINIDLAITHSKLHEGKSTRNLQIYENRIAEGEEISPRAMYYYARELHENRRYLDAIKWFTMFLDSGKGWVEDNIAACGERAKCYQKLNRLEDALSSLLFSFKFDTPRAEICCQLGYYFKDLRSYKKAAFWFNLVLQLERNPAGWGFQQEDCWGYIPSIECAVCYDNLGEYEKASDYNDRAAVYKPDSPSVLHNKEYLRMRCKNNP